MLENDCVGQRSGISPFCGLAVSQNHWKVRRSRSSTPDPDPTARLLGASAVDWHDPPRRMTSAANAADVRRIVARSEIHFQSDLLAPSKTDHTARLSERRGIRIGCTAEAVTTTIRPAERIEDLNHQR